MEFEKQTKRFLEGRNDLQVYLDKVNKVRRQHQDMTMTSAKVIEETKKNIKRANNACGFLRPLLDEMKECADEDSENQQTVEYYENDLTETAKQIEGLSVWLDQLGVAEKVSASLEPEPEKRVGGSQRSDCSGGRRSAKSGSAHGAHLSAVSSARSRHSGSHRSDGSGSVGSRLSTVSSATRKRLEARAEVQMIEEQQKLAEKRRREDAELAAKNAELAAKKSAMDAELAAKKSAMESEMAARKLERELEDKKLKAIAQYKVQSEIELLEDSEQNLGPDDPDRLMNIGACTTSGWTELPSGRQTAQVSFQPTPPFRQEPGTVAPNAGGEPRNDGVPNAGGQDPAIRAQAPPFNPVSMNANPTATTSVMYPQYSSIPTASSVTEPRVALSGVPPSEQQTEWQYVGYPATGNWSAGPPPPPTSYAPSDSAALAEFLLIGPASIDKFEGDHSKWLPFISGFESSIASKTRDENRKMSKLWENLGRGPRSYVEGYLLDPVTGYQRAVTTLWSVYGTPTRLVESIVEGLLENKSQLRADEHEALLKLRLKIGSALETVAAVQRRFDNNKIYDYMQVLDTRENLLNVLKRLPPFMQRDFVSEIGDHPGNLGRLHEFLVKKTHANSHPLLSALTRDRKGPTGPVKPPVQSRVNALPKKVFSAERGVEEVTGGSTKQSVANPPPGCPACSSETVHSLLSCNGFKNMNVKKKWQTLQSHKRCYNCLKASHLSRDCPEENKCSKEDCRMKAKHHPSLHVTERIADSEANESPRGERPKKNENSRGPDPQSNNADRSSDSLLGVMAVRLRNPHTGKSISCYALLDGSANVDVASKELVRVLGLSQEVCEDEETIHTITGSKDMKCMNTSVVAQSFEGEAEKLLNDVLVLDCHHFSKSRCPSIEDIKGWEQLQNLVPTDSVEYPKVMLLISVKNPDLTKPRAVIDLSDREDGPYALETKLGFALHGGDETTKERTANFINAMTNDENVKEMLCPEDMSGVYDTRKGSSVNEKLALRKMQEGLEFKEGRFVVPIPFEEEDIEMPDNLNEATRCLEGMRKRFRKNPKYFAEYAQAIQKYIDNGHAVKVKDEEIVKPKGKTFHLLHHSVKHPRKDLRIVFNLSKRFKGKSLNDVVLTCPDVLEKLVGILVRFREEPVAVTGDIKGFFHAVRVPEEDSDLLRFLWFENGDVEGKIVPYQMTVHTFGGIASQCAAVVALAKALNRSAGDLLTKEEVAKAIRAFYSDDFLKSFKDTQEATNFVEKVRRVLEANGFILTKFESTDEKVTEALCAGKKAAEKAKETTALGIKWNPREDQLSFDFAMKEPKGSAFTKREVLSQLMSLYDPLGLLTPFIIPLKLAMHDLVIAGYGWDEEIPEVYQKEVVRCLKSLENVASLIIPRCYSHEIGPVMQRDLHVFGDGSTTSYGCAAYVRSVDEAGRVQVSLVEAKNRLSPMQPKLTVPKTELCASTMAVRLGTELLREMESPIEEIHYWTDSTTVLKYLRNKVRRFKIFEDNRISEIRTLSDPEEQWHYVPTKMNPADCASRPVFLEPNGDLNEANHLWFRGPEFLYESKSEWPVQPEEGILSHELEESEEAFKNSAKIIQFADSTKLQNESRKEMERKQQQSIVIEKLYTAMVKCPTIDHVRRRIALLRSYVKWIAGGRKEKPNAPSCSDLADAELCAIRISQLRSFGKEIELVRKGKRPSKSSPIRKLNPVYDDENKVLRVGTRLKNASVSYEYKYPLIVPKDAHLCHLIVRDAHLRVGHLGTDTVLSELREKLWLVGARVTVNAVVRRCLVCRRYNAKIGEQLMADLPESRVQMGRPPFSDSAVDLFGPFFARRGRSDVKRYGCIFTCLAIRSVHLEMVSDLSLDSFIQAFRRFTSRRGQILSLRSDQGTNFRGADRELVEALEEWNASGIERSLQQAGVDWHFNTSGASHHGGAHERLIRSVRSCIRHVVDTQSMTDESLSTLFAEAECIMNSRPLVSFSSDPDCLKPLTPNDLLLLRPGKGLPPGHFPEGIVWKKRWKQVQAVVDQFWRRFRQEYLRHLSLRTKWALKRRNFRVGDLVLMVDSNLPRSQWSLARVSGVKTGEDDLVRSVRVRTATSEYERPITKIVLLEGAEVDMEEKPVDQ